MLNDSAAGAPVSYISLESANDSKVKCEYAVRGKILDRAMQVEEEIRGGSKKYDFDSIVYANIGNPQALGQKPVTYCRQLVAAVMDPALTGPDSPYPSDVKAKAKEIIQDMPGHSAGSYTDTKGVMLIREKIAKAISKRDGYPSDPENIFLTTGATQGINLFLDILISHDNVGIMVPCPQYPIYSALITSVGGKIVYYNLDENNAWDVDMQELERAISASTAEVRAICVINPGNPTGGLLKESSIKEIIKFASKHNLALMADEVYQLNIIGYRKFVSTRKVLYDLGPEYSNVQLISLNSASKGIFCECGMRGGYFECTNISDSGMSLITKLSSMKLCSPTAGQVVLSAIADPPVPGDPSYELYKKEVASISKTFADRAEYFYQSFCSTPYVKFQAPVASIYLYPGFALPDKFVKEAQSRGMQPDELLCLLLVEKKGVCTTPGSGFSHQGDGFHYIRITITPDGIERVVDSIKSLFDWIHEVYG